MRKLLQLLVGCVGIVACVRGTTISYESTPVGLNSSGDMLYQYTYTVSGLTLQANQELDIYYSASVYATLSDAVAPSSLQPLVLQPNNPPGAPGDFSLYSSTDDSVVTGPLSIDYTLLSDAVAGPQTYEIYQYSADGTNPVPISLGTTVPATVVTTPEPASGYLAGFTLLLGMFWWTVRSRCARVHN